MNTPTELIKNIHLPSATFGHEEAEYDAVYLADHFVSIPALFPILDGRTNVVVGPKGSGKSALFSFLSNGGYNVVDSGPSIEKHLENRKFDPLSVALVSGKLDKRDSDDSTLKCGDYRDVWLTAFAISVATFIVRDFQSAVPRNLRRFQSQCKQSGLDNSLLKKALSATKEMAQRLLSSIRVRFNPDGSASVEINGIDTKSGTSIELIEPIPILEAADAFFVAEEFDYRLCIDDIDKIYSYEKESEVQLVRGLFEANDSLKHLNRFRPIIFIRKDILFDARITQIDKTLARSVNIDWDLEAAMELLVSRLTNCDELRELVKYASADKDGPFEDSLLSLVFPFETQNLAPSQLVREWLVKNLSDANGNIYPRTIIYFLNQVALCNRQGNEEESVFNAKALSAALPIVSDMLVSVLFNDYQVAAQIIEVIESNGFKQFSFSDLQAYFPSDESPLISNQLEYLVRNGYLTKTSSIDGAVYNVANLYSHHWSSKQ